ncbi:MAG: LLM class flavin-dependent oxidoreductase [Pseudomonadota bacterium]
MRVCTWAPTVFQGPQLVGGSATSAQPMPRGDALTGMARAMVQRYEALGLTDLLIAQRWWGSGVETEGSSLDALAMTSFFASCTERLNLVTAIHPGFFTPTAIAKWGATLDTLTAGRWSINVTSGWNLQEFDMYGIDALDHDARYRRAGEFIEVVRGAWDARGPFDYSGDFYAANALRLAPTPAGELQVFQGGQSDAAIAMAGRHSDWMFLNGGRDERVADIVTRARSAAATHGRRLRFALYAAPLCRPTDAEAWAEIDTRLAQLDPALVERRKALVGGAEGMWGDADDPLSHLDTNEGYAARLIGSPASILERIDALQSLGIDMLHLDLRDELFVAEVLPALIAR